MASVSDDFNRANNADAGANWTTQTGSSAMRINANQLMNIGTGTFSAEYWNANTFGDDQEASGVVGTELETSTGASDLGIGPAIRMSITDETKYVVIMSADTAREFQLLEFDAAGGITVLGTYTAGTMAPGDEGLTRGIGTTISGRLNGTERISVTDATLTTGRIGACGRQDSNACGLTSWAGGDTGPPPSYPIAWLTA